MANYRRQKALFGNMTLKEDVETGKKLIKAIAKKAEVHQEIQRLEEQIVDVKDKKKNTDRKITFASLPQQEQFTNAINVRKHFMDNIKMIAYRAETAMYHMIKHQLGPHHRMKAENYCSKFMLPMPTSFLIIQIKPLPLNCITLIYRKNDKAVAYLCEKLNETETEFPGTDLKIIYQLVSS